MPSTPADDRKTVTIGHPDAADDLTFPEDQADRYTLGGWSQVTDTTAKPPKK
jgi:hypothetical protein